MPGLTSALPLLGQTSSGAGAGGGGGTDAEIIDGIGITPLPFVVRTQPASLSQGIGSHDALATPILGVVMLEHLRVAFTQVTNQKARLVTADGVHMGEALVTALPAALTQGIGVAATQQVQLAVKVIEDLGLTAALVPIFKYHLSLADAIRMSEALSRFMGAGVVDAIHIQPVMTSSAVKPGTLSEAIGVAASVTPRMILRVTTADEIGIADDQLLRMIYHGNLADTVEIVAGYIAPNGSFTTWAINTRSGAVTEYSNYAFNSFAKIGDVYFGASSSGLYKLLGDDDAGTDIIADIKSGFAQWAGSKFAMFQGVYLGLRGSGDFVLKVITGDDKIYIYTVSAQSQQTTKITTGKGLKARYFAFELISTGQDFDLDTIEFVPLASTRRV
jgi:hypothetical protein